MPRGGKRDGAGRKPHPEPPADPTKHSGPVTATDRKFAEELLANVFKPGTAEDTEELKWWRELFYNKEPRVRLDVGKYWYDKRDGKAIQPVDVDASVSGAFTVIMDLPAKKPRDGR